MEVTFAMIKPDAVAALASGKIIDIIEKAGFDILEMKKVFLPEHLIRAFYAEHAGKPFFEAMVEFIISGPVIVLALEKENAVVEWRTLMGATNPKDAQEGTIRALFGESIDHNAVHGSDSLASAQRELELVFQEEFYCSSC